MYLLKVFLFLPASVLSLSASYLEKSRSFMHTQATGRLCYNYACLHSPSHKGGCGIKSKTSNKIISVLPQSKCLILQFFQLYFNVFFALRSSTFVSIIAMRLIQSHKPLHFPYFCLVFSCLVFPMNRRLGNKHTIFVVFHLYPRFFQQISYIFWICMESEYSLMRKN